MNKKLLALLLAILMVAMSAVAMAQTAATATLTGLTKVFTTDFSTNDGLARIPNETLNFTATATSLTLPDGTTGSVDQAPQLTGSIAPSGLSNTTDAPNAYTGTFSISTTEAWPSAGIYTYKAKETPSTIQGVTYSTDEILFEVLVSYVQSTNADSTTSQSLQVTNIGLKKDTEGNKNGTFTNAYNSGSVKVTKTVSGNAASIDDEFNVDVTFEAAEGKVFDANVAVLKNNGTLNQTLSTDKKKITASITVKHGSEITLSNIPVGTKVTVAENDTKVNAPEDTDATKYTATYSGNGAVVSSAAQTIAITNSRTSSIDTGVTTDSMPYILLMAFVAILAVAFVAKKRSVKE
ncbi:MAG: DUF5979 domain-containing protein [Candidatus Ventricola sp.]|nr:DUF5979 domain-containing protein [Candidatus Ventricola sp.]